MADPSILDWATSVATVLSAVAAACAALFARIAAKLAGEQVALQRPHPVVLAKFVYCLEGEVGSGDQAIQLLNIGDSTAFDIQVADLVVPHDYIIPAGVMHLKTAKLFHLCSQEKNFGTHIVKPAPGPQPHLEPMVQFVNGLAEAFMQESAKKIDGTDDRYSIDFVVTYRALDGEQFKQKYDLVFQLRQHRAVIEPVGSLLQDRIS